MNDDQSQRKSAFLGRVSAEIRLRHFSYRTEQTYIHWIVRFIRFHKNQHPDNLNERHVAAFLSHLAVDKDVAASTQNQALSAILFLYKAVVGRELGEIAGLVRAKRPVRLPVVLTVDEVRRLLQHIDIGSWLPACLMYGSGLRVTEAIRLRTKDLDFDHRAILVRSGKGDRDRVVTLPDELIVPLRRQLQAARLLHDKDLADGYGAVSLPAALQRKYPNAASQWAWQYVFPSRNRSTDPRSGQVRRHHIDVSVVQRGHRDVRTTQIYTHVLNRGGSAVLSPLGQILLPRR